MSYLALSLALLSAAPQGGERTVVRSGESWASVARRALGDERAAAELQALNGMTGVELPAGTELKLPGPERSLAVSALGAARRAVEQTRKPERKEQAAGKLKEAEGLLRSARYAEAAKEADRAWRLVSEQADQPTRFAVRVDEKGATKVKTQAGAPVVVEAQGVSRRVYPGQQLKVEKGAAPAEPRPQLTAPALVAPAVGGKVRVGALALSWQPVAGAEAYEVEVLPAEDPSAKPTSLKSSGAKATVASLAAGRYVWTVRAVAADGERSELSERRTFELVDEPLRLDVGEAQWK